MKTINHKNLGGDVVTKMPQRKPDKAKTGRELLNKAVLGTSKPPTDEQKRNKEWKEFVKK